ncbi:MAG: Nif3-like dinuclear metal center hexameric protein, partial [Ruminococcaceae bacterium]|nr:Nif3-like dinuclear metal center hexameric protein [Oscillospiraceae bacterium]
MTFYELYKNLSKLYPEELRCDWDNDGIMCAQSLDAKVKRVLLALDVTLDTVEYAINN